MKATKKKRLESADWQVGDASDFLNLSPEESALVDLRLALADCLKSVRSRKHWTQAAVAKKVGSSQSRVAKMEAGDSSVSLDLLMRSLLALGVTRKELARVVAP